MDTLGLNPNPQDSPNPLLAQIRRQTMQQAQPQPPAPLPPPAMPETMGMVPSPTPKTEFTGRGTLTGEQNERTRLLTEGAPSGHIAGKIEGAMPNHPALGKTLGLAAQIPAQIGDTLLSAIAPGLASRVPGTEGHHQALVNREDTLVGNLSKQGLEQAQGEEAQARAGALNNPKDEFTPLPTESGYESFSHRSGTATPLIEGGNQLQPIDKTKPEPVHYANLADGSVVALTRGADGKVTADEVWKGDPKVRTQVIDRDIGGKPHNVLVNADTGEDIRDLGAKGERPPTIRVETPHEKFGEKQALLKLYQPALDSAERFNVMAKNYEDAVKTNDQQAMLSLLTNHIGMTLGLQKGARITQQAYREAEQAAPWLSRIGAKFGPDGYLSGVTLTKSQMRQMVDLARGRFGEDMVKAKNEAGYMGAIDEGPSRTASDSVMRMYLNEYGNDAAKARAAMQKDGWSL